MTTLRPLYATPPTGSVLLGRFSVWFGSVVLPIYLALFVLALTRSLDRPEAGLDLPPWLPEIGLALGALGFAFARLLRRRVPTACLAGLVLNAIPMLMAWALPLLRRAG